MLTLGGTFDEDLCMTLKCLPNRLLISCKGEKKHSGEIRQHLIQVAKINITNYIDRRWVSADVTCCERHITQPIA